MALPKKVEILTIRKSKSGKPIIVFNKGVTVAFKGEELSLGEYNTVFIETKEKLLESLDYLEEKEYITSEIADERRTKLEEKNITGAVTINTGR